MEYLQGTKLQKIIRSKGNTNLKKQIASIGAHAILKQIFIDHFFHGDLHPGNLFWIADEHKLGFIDFGLVGMVNQDELKALTMMLMGVTENDATKLTLGIEGLGIIDTSDQSAKLKNRIEKMLAKYFDSKLEEIQMSIFIKEIFDIMHDLQIRFPVDLVVLAKSLISVEGFATELDPNFNMFTFCRPYIELALENQYDLKHIKSDLENTFFQSTRFIKGLPNDLYWILKRVKNNNFKIKLEHLHLQKLLNGIEIVGNRVSFSLIVAALIIGSSYVIPYYRGLGLFGYIMASLLGIGLLISMFKKNKL